MSRSNDYLSGTIEVERQANNLRNAAQLTRNKAQMDAAQQLFRQAGTRYKKSTKFRRAEYCFKMAEISPLPDHLQ